jgi:hypothetical protein
MYDVTATRHASRAAEHRTYAAADIAIAAVFHFHVKKLGTNSYLLARYLPRDERVAPIQTILKRPSQSVTMLPPAALTAAALAAPAENADHAADVDVAHALRVAEKMSNLGKTRPEQCGACWGAGGRRGCFHEDVFVSTRSAPRIAKWAKALGIEPPEGRALYVCRRWLPHDFDPDNPRFELAAADGRAHDVVVDVDRCRRAVEREQQKALLMAAEQHKGEERRKQSLRRQRDTLAAEYAAAREQAMKLYERWAAASAELGDALGDAHAGSTPSCLASPPMDAPSPSAVPPGASTSDGDDDDDDYECLVADAVVESSCPSPTSRARMGAFVPRRAGGASAFCRNGACPVCVAHSATRGGVDWRAVDAHDAALKYERSRWVPHLLTFRTLDDVHAFALMVYTSQFIGKGKRWNSLTTFFDALCMVLMRSRRAFAYLTVSFITGTPFSTVQRIIHRLAPIAGAFCRTTFGFGVIDLDSHVPPGHKGLIPSARLCFDSTYVPTEKPSDYTLQSEL